ncbi:hypothetical protein [Spirilliplanes yamanashiensis]|uniref:Uncharacterized protein n=1 Tax=Spirilliplanes yamanashiensis TaxID=42233 RepID=A0A8J4DHG6_9ACTN|nr:hypothetical protein [Spirilliplanes yamanashiensis]MDP9819863.1 hypothetical protein [Spirilliplanes yamanashiensis]GIJ01318.1 hypothetical protein Sya03_06700 [Spirilliplanes yamanashiensis]
MTPPRPVSGTSADAGRGLPEFMEELGRHGVTMLLKVDHERFGSGQRPWTLVLSGPGLGDLRALHADFRTFQEALEYCRDRLRGLPGEWEWLDGYSWG